VRNEPETNTPERRTPEPRELERTYLELTSAAEHRARSGRPLVGIVGRDVPAVLVSAAGAEPFRICVSDVVSDEATTIMGRAVDRAAAAALTAVLSGSLDFLRGILISHDSEGSVRLFYTLHELHRRGRISTPVRMVDQVHLNRPATLRFNHAQLSQMWDTLVDWTSSAITNESLATAIAEHAAVRTALRTMRDTRRRGGTTGLAALHCYTVAACVRTADAASIIAAAHNQPPTAEADVPALPVFLTGSSPIGDRLYRLIESAGAVITGEDHDWGDPILSDQLPQPVPAARDDLLLKLAASRLHGAPAAATSSMAARAKATREGIAASGARALLSIVRAHDEAPLWDWRHQSATAGVPAVQLRENATDNPADDAASIRAVIETLRAAA
jgi:hypothetical protein